MKKFFVGVIWVLGSLLGIIGAIGSFFGASFIVNNIPMLCIISLFIGFFIIFGMGKLARVVLGKKSKSHSPIIVASVIMASISLFCACTVFKPLPGPIIIADKPANTKYWELSTGSRVAYWHYAAEGTKKPTPIIFLHGGPGGYVRDLERNFLAKFTKEGYDVYLYDQPGAGFSDILKRDEYTIYRFTQDIEAIRKEIGAEKVIIVGQSFGSVLGSSYIAKYPNNVEKIIFTSPGELSEETSDVKYKKPRNASDFIKPFEPTFAEDIRTTVWDILNSTNREASENFVSQKEITDYYTRMTTDIFAMSFPPSYFNKLPKFKGGGINFNANIDLRSDFKKESNNLREKLKKINVPVLILRGEYDYVLWHNTREYRELYPNSKLVYIKDSGHILWAVNEKDTYNAMSAFMQNKPMPLPNYNGEEDPSISKGHSSK